MQKEPDRNAARRTGSWRAEGAPWHSIESPRPDCDPARKATLRHPTARRRFQYVSPTCIPVRRLHRQSRLHWPSLPRAFARRLVKTALRRRNRHSALAVRQAPCHVRRPTPGLNLISASPAKHIAFCIDAAAFLFPLFFLFFLLVFVFVLSS